MRYALCVMRSATSSAQGILVEETTRHDLKFDEQPRDYRNDGVLRDDLIIGGRTTKLNIRLSE
jgi:hypothetical protein